MKMRLQQAFFNSSQGPQHREFQKEILQAMRVGVWAPTQKLTKSQLTIMCKSGWDNEINFVKISFLSHSRVLC
ncbi:nitrogen fixation protein NifR [Staphylococcus aureus]|nr:nitrogen fixation protein NifR [Staphylococcus aureus]PZG99236.1 nitrogen fixation protein NifR [Staphylococcus aureus]